MTRSGGVTGAHTSRRTGANFRPLRRYRTLYLFLLPALATVIVFYYTPMAGVVMAFQDYTASRGWAGSPSVGLRHFAEFLVAPDFYRALSNTLGINLLMIVIGFPLPVIFALLINELKPGAFKRATQSITYLPHFISWVVVASMAYRLLEQDYGNVNLLLSRLGFPKIAFFREARYFWGILVTTAIWKELGWSTIIYLAALAAIDQEQYEAATVDGAGRLSKLVHISLPGIATTVALLFILTVGNLVTSVGGAGFEAVFNLQNALVASRSTTIDFYVYTQGVRMNNVSLATAIGLSQSVISVFLVFASNQLCKRIRGYGLF